MKLANRQNRVPKVPPVANYSLAIARAVEWLGDRYLLAKPINAAADRLADGTSLRAVGPQALGDPEAVGIAASD